MKKTSTLLRIHPPPWTLTRIINAGGSVESTSFCQLGQSLVSSVSAPRPLRQGRGLTQELGLLECWVTLTCGCDCPIDYHYWLTIGASKAACHKGGQMPSWRGLEMRFFLFLPVPCPAFVRALAHEGTVSSVCFESKQNARPKRNDIYGSLNLWPRK